MPRNKGLRRPGTSLTFMAMRALRSAGPFVLALLLVLGLAEGGDHPPLPAVHSLSSISAPRESLPQPVHDEATCAFCQAAIFPPCAPQPAGLSIRAQGLERIEQPGPDSHLPNFTSHRPASSRAPPALRSA
jgi:hypothetical protein